jgi:RimJ/RimL family protein N-acetyltransferase
MTIRKAAGKDLDEIMEIYRRARQFMVESGNPTQWAEGHPSRLIIEQDITRGISYVCEDIHGIQGVFAFIIGEDPTYKVIENGAWLREDTYGTVHRLASAGVRKGVASRCFHWCFDQCGNLRVDTHEDNKVMQHLIEQNGFVQCGQIYAENGTPRIAYQKIK